MNLEYKILGPVEVWADGRQVDVGGARQRRLIAALVLADGRAVPPERLMDIVWVGEPPDKARNTLRTYVARARRALEVNGVAPLHTETSGWRLARDHDELDSERFETLLDAARAAAADPIVALATIEDALSLWRDDALVEFRDEDWCSAEAVRLDELRLSAEEERFEAMLSCGLYDEVIGELERFTERHPLRDRSRGQQMLALYRAGRQVEAVRLFQRYRRYLQDQVGVEPSDELRSLDRRIIERDPSLRQLAPAGRQLRGYRLGQQIGAGAFGRIYRASQPALGREVAIKVARPELADDPEFIRRFDAEAQFIARLEHPHIVPLFDYWREPGGAYLVMRYLRGGSASELLESGGPLPLDRVSQIVEEIGGALVAAHAQRVVHRDVKPANILFDEHGSSYLADFGIAAGVGAALGPQPDSRSGAIYSSPEQAARGEVAPGADIYAFGAVLFELLTNEPPFPRATPLPDLIQRKTRHRLDLPKGDFPQALNEVIQRATAPDPARRFPSVGDLVVAFRSAVGHLDRAPGRAVGWSARNPYKGLAAFGEPDATDFFGRDRLAEELKQAVASSRFVAVVGPSGSGKSSLVRAGLVPRLRTEGAYVVTMVPGPRPLDELTRALLQVAPAAGAADVVDALDDVEDGLVRAADRCLPHGAGELVVIVDQFEELFTMTEASMRSRFLGLIAVAVRSSARVRVVVTLRADFYDRPLADATIGELVQANSVAVTPLSAADLERAITTPAAQVGVTVEPALVAALVADASAASMPLPLVQYELTQLFDRRDGDTLTVSSYERQGGLGGAIARRADEIFDGHDETGREAARRLFGRLVTPGDRGDDSRRRVRMSELTTVDSELIAVYAEARLLTLDSDPVTREPTVEIAHEALIHAWPRLRGWVDADRDGLRLLQHLSTSAATWDAGRRDPADLYRGGRLVAAEEWSSGHPNELNPLEQAFVDASVSARDAAQMRERRRVRRLRGLVVTLGVVAVLAMVAGLVALTQRRAAQDNAADAERRLLENQTAQLLNEASVALDQGDADLAILLGLAAFDRSSEISDTPRPGVVATLFEAVQSSRLEAILDAGFSEIAVSPDGGTVALDHDPDRNRLATYDIASGTMIAERTFDGNVGGVAYSPDGGLLAVPFCCTAGTRGEDQSAMLLLDPGNLETIHQLDGGVQSWAPSWSSDGRHVLNLGPAGVRIWSVGEPEVERVLEGTDGDSSAEFVPGSNSVAVVRSELLEVIDLDSGEALVSHRVPAGASVLRVSPTGELVAFIEGATDNVQVLDLETGESVLRIAAASPQDVRFAPDGRSLSIVGNADFVRVVIIETGEVRDLGGLGAGSWRHAHIPGGDQMLVAMRDGGTRVWNLTPAGPRGLGNITIGGRARGAQPLDDSTVLVAVQTADDELDVKRVDLTTDTSEIVAELWFDDFQWPAFSPDGALVAGFARDTRLPTVFDVESGRALATFRPCETPRMIDPANQWILVQSFSCPDSSQSPAETESRTGFVDMVSGDLVVGIDDPDDVFEAALGPPDSVAADVVAYQGSGGVIFRRASTLEVLSVWDLPSEVQPLSVAFSPDGTKFGVSSAARQGIVFDVGAILDGADARDAVTIHDEMHSGPTQRVIPVGDSIVTTGAGTEVRQWDAGSGALLVDVSTDLGQFVQLFALPDGKTLFYADQGGVMRRYLTDPADLVELARSRVQRDFTDSECVRFFPSGDCPT